NETFGGEKFFQLLERLSRNPVKHLHLLELMYLCLSLGFEGKYRVMPRGTLELEVIRDSLYRQIRQLRGDVPSEISPHWQGLQGERGQFGRAAPWWAVPVHPAVPGGGLWRFQLGAQGAAPARSSGIRTGQSGLAGRHHLQGRSEEHTSELQSRENLVCRLLLEKKKKKIHKQKRAKDMQQM